MEDKKLKCEDYQPCNIKDKDGYCMNNLRSCIWREVPDINHQKLIILRNLEDLKNLDIKRKADKLHYIFKNAIWKNGRPNHIKEHAKECAKACCDILYNGILEHNDLENNNYYLSLKNHIDNL
jgi:hypothetical protein